MRIQSLILTIAIIFTSFTVLAQKAEKPTFVKAETLTMVGKMMPTKNIYRRIDTADYRNFSPIIKRLFTNSAGLAVAFSTDSKMIDAKWCNSNSRASVNLTPIAQKGLDLYVKIDGKWQFAGVGKPTAPCSKGTLVKNMKPGMKEFLLYLPLYDSIDSLEIGIEKNATIKPLADPFGKRVLIYGSSILQGAGASRAGMAYPAILARQTGINFINMGLSGNGKMEKEVADLVAKIDAEAFILDCIPNPTPQQIKERTAYLVQTIRKNHPKAPIIVMQSEIRESGYVDMIMGARNTAQNKEITMQVEALQKAGIKDLYLIKGDDFLGSDHDGTVDGTHPNDLGFGRMVEVIRPQIMTILKKYGIE